MMTTRVYCVGSETQKTTGYIIHLYSYTYFFTFYKMLILLRTRFVATVRLFKRNHKLDAETLHYTIINAVLE